MSDKYCDYQYKVLKAIYRKYIPKEAQRHLPKNISQEDWSYLCDV